MVVPSKKKMWKGSALHFYWENIRREETKLDVGEDNKIVILQSKKKKKKNCTKLRVRET